MKHKSLAAFASILMSGLLVGCGYTGGATEAAPEPQTPAITGSPSELLPKLTESANQALPGDQVVKTFDEPVTADLAKNQLGLTPEQFTAEVKEAYSARAAIMTIPSTTVLVEAKDAAAAKLVAEQVAAGYDSTQWVCVMPEKSVVSVAGNYVLLAVGTDASTTALTNSFSELAGGANVNPVVFYTGPAAGEGDAAPGMTAVIPG